jgi:hypothetical protein
VKVRARETLDTIIYLSNTQHLATPISDHPPTMSDSTSDYPITESPPPSDDDFHHPPASDVSDTPSLTYSFNSDLTSENEPIRISFQDKEEMISDQTNDSAPVRKSVPTQDPAPQPFRRANRLPQKSIHKLLLEASGLPIVVWNEQERQWTKPWFQPRRTMQSQITAMINTDLNETLIRELLTAIVFRQKEEPEYPPHACFGCAVILGDRKLCSNDEFSTTACTECVAFGRPCGQLCELPAAGDALEKAFAFGFLPLPEAWREGWNSMWLSYYVRVGTKVEPAVPKGKEQEWAVWR